MPPRTPRSLRQSASIPTLLALGLLAGCGGGGGNGAIAPLQSEVRLTASPLTMTGDSGDLLVTLADDLIHAPSLLQVAIELPAELLLPATDRLTAARPLATLDGDTVPSAFVVLCGDANNVDAAPLSAGPLFRLRLLARQPRTPGTYQVQLREVHAATDTGDAVATVSAPITVAVTLQE